MSEPAVTIVIPTFNRAEWLRGSIDSVLAQDYPDLELLVVDDGSTDATPELLSDYERRYERDRFRALAQANAGQAAAINRGWDLARGDLVGYLADDDLLAEGGVSRLVAELVADPGCVVAYPGYHIIDADGHIHDTIRPIEYSPLEAVRLHDTIIGPGALIRRDALARAGAWDPELRWIGDLILWLRLSMHGRVTRVAEPLASWRRHPEGATSQVGLEHAREHLQVAELGIDLLGGDAVDRGDRAEALRNACIFGSFFGGDPSEVPANRWATVDLQRPAISAYGAGIRQWHEIPDERADVAADLWRELALAITELAALRGRGAPPPGGLEAARALLGRVGLLGGTSTAVDPGEVRTAMLEAAWHCSADSGIERTRFLVVDATDGTVTPEEFEELSHLGIYPWHDDVRAVIARRTEEIERLRATTPNVVGGLEDR
jgi:hypothetical protein